ncbi:16S rRNA (cytidine1402-2'-O)-methyltransferase [Marininema mesophilum]|uniref:Ribosomal RNA small subunit methyltransferase I n=1 Tax=Marininema mesophilum TaxID=1048340 RepID=A0A1H2WY44_9BACL|nr:16S rRNA (cytidine(1402)-2'-O)-methyltransferase [Marininema mesophilum]SDW85436.1 16S rRNA (cytidine1402-2'-O)-methyltransferase [Marininema mesophilum]
MKRQKSFEEDGGALYIVGTPIGNLGDASERVRDTLAEVDCVACEDTRHTKKLFSHWGLSKATVSYHEHNRYSRGPELVERMKKGERIALVSDAGMPGLSDPGEDLVKEAVERGVPVIPIPGPNAALTAVVASGIQPQPYLFIGFLPRHSKERRKELTKWKETLATLLFYEAPHRIKATLADLIEVLGDREVAIARELTKKHEEWLRGTLTECAHWFEEEIPRGEMTVVVAGVTSESDLADNETEPEEWWRALTTIEHVDWHIRRGMSKKEAIQETANIRSLPKREVYNEYHREQE